MPETRRPDPLQLRKQLVLLESELNRIALREDLGRVRDSIGQISPLSLLGRGDGGISWLMKAAPVVGLIAGTAPLAGQGWIRRGLRVVQIAAAAYPIWKVFKALRSPEKGGKPDTGGR